MGILDFMRRRKKQVKQEREEPKSIEEKLKSLKSMMSTTTTGRPALYRFGLRLLIEAGGASFIIFECKEKTEYRLKFIALPGAAGLICEVSGEPISKGGRRILLSMGFKAPDKSNSNYSQAFEAPQPRTLAELLEKVFMNALECPDSYTAHVVEAAYQE